MSEQINNQQDLENKKRKAEEKDDSSKGHINKYFLPSQKSKAPSAFRKTVQVITPTQKTRKPKELKYKGETITYLCIIVDVLPDKDCTGRHRLALSRFFTSMKTPDPDAVILLCEL